MIVKRDRMQSVQIDISGTVASIKYFWEFQISVSYFIFGRPALRSLRQLEIRKKKISFTKKDINV